MSKLLKYIISQIKGDWYSVMEYLNAVNDRDRKLASILKVY